MINRQLRRIVFPLLFLAGAVFLVSCDGVADLDVENKNAPDREQAVTDPGDVQSILQGAYRSFYVGIYSSGNFPGPHLDMMGGAVTTTNAFDEFISFSVKPMGQVQNTSGYSGAGVMEVPWNNLNAALSSSNDVLTSIEVDDLEITIDGNDQTARTRAGAYLVRGLSHGYIANLFNQGYVQTLDFPQNASQPALSGYGTVVDQAISDLQQARTIAENNSFDLAGLLPWQSPPSSPQVASIANTMSARFLVQNSRTLDENTSSTIGGSEEYGWNDVLGWTQNGIDEDIDLQLSTNPYEDSYAGLSTVVNWYYRADHRIINLMDPDYPARYPVGRAEAAEAIPSSENLGSPPADDRICEEPKSLDTDGGFGHIDGAGRKPEGCFYIYTNDFQAGFDAGRDASSFSTYFWAPQWATTIGNETPYGGGPRPLFLVNENRTLQAEAEIRAPNGGGVSAAEAIINDGSRTNIGGLPDLNGSTENEALRAIYYERAVQLQRTVPALAWTDLRRRDALFEGTPKHLPVPAEELNTVQRDLYTFGGGGNAGQPGTASGESAWCTGDNPLVGNTVPSSGCDPSGYSAPAASNSSLDGSKGVESSSSRSSARTPQQ
ncbi:RagB/SusD family nutrient uptake outer membrane protein [Salinibacter grassmerensis]|uniref:RagB/SusD family nutrient uptake outer membrane protein n=1 Tax=Salinibacter grassmerensis TaxID=3040353 RepID=UPI0021E6F46A|nr:RagB/SusD family nutrient uptake outer membrane protein [Salinibacter grassmerensis]